MCGVFGVRSVERDVARLTYFGLFALQHRGQESAGIAVSEDGRITTLRDLGLVSQVFDEERLAGLHGQVAIGHTRYSTTGGASWENAQPLLHRVGERTVSLAHNGNLVHLSLLRDELLDQGVRLGSTSDSEVIAALLARDPAPIQDAVANTMRRVDGAYSVVAVVDGILVAFRDPHGIRPLSLGRIGADWVIASETCAFDLVDAVPVRDVSPGEVVWIDDEGLHAMQAVEPARPALCVFEAVYFARPDSRLGGGEVHQMRVRMGERLAEESPVDADLVMPIPDSGTPAAIGYAKRSGIPYEEGLIKNRYIGRTFIQPDEELRRRGIRLKFNPLQEVSGRRIVIVDDSIVRGNTMRALVQMLFDAGAAEVHVRVSSPPVVSPCFYGIDMADEEQLVGADRTVEETRAHIGATSLAYLSVAGMQGATGLPASSTCAGCFTRSYPTRIPDTLAVAKHRFEGAGVRT
jgi:amidophosphoribosyltransferase